MRKTLVAKTKPASTILFETCPGIPALRRRSRVHTSGSQCLSTKQARKRKQNERSKQRKKQAKQAKHASEASKACEASKASVASKGSKRIKRNMHTKKQQPGPRPVDHEQLLFWDEPVDLVPALCVCVSACGARACVQLDWT